MKIVIFGLSVSSSWGNGHATIWRGLMRALERRGHRVVFFERDTPYYAAHRDPPEACACDLVLFGQWEHVAARARSELAGADVGIVTSFCPDAIRAADLLFSSNASLRVFYDLDTPITIEKVRFGEDVAYLGPRGFADFDLVLSFTGGRALVDARDLLGARAIAPLYGSVDPEVHRPATAVSQYRGAISHIGTFAPDRQAALDLLFFEPARRLRSDRFVLAGPLYPEHVRLGENVRHYPHLSPIEHPSFYASSVLTLNVTRGVMKKYGYCPSGRLFEAAACAAPLLSDRFEGLERFFEPGREILIADTTEEALEALQRPRIDLRTMAERARDRALEAHSADVRVRELEDLLGGASPHRMAAS
jgi:spore maturation protein CgeB